MYTLEGVNELGAAVLLLMLLELGADAALTLSRRGVIVMAELAWCGRGSEMRSISDMEILRQLDVVLAMRDCGEEAHSQTQELEQCHSHEHSRLTDL